MLRQRCYEDKPPLNFFHKRNRSHQESTSHEIHVKMPSSTLNLLNVQENDGDVESEKEDVSTTE